MKLSLNNFLYGIRHIVTGGGRHTDGSPYNDSGFLKRAEGVSLSNLLPSLTDSTGGTASSTLASTVGVSQIAFHANLAAGPPAGTSAGDMVTTFVPGFKFKLLALDFVTSTVGVGAGASQVYNLEIGTTNVTGGTCTVTEASTSAVGELTAGAAITALNTGSATDTISIEQAASGTAFTGGEGVFIVTIQNMDTADAVASLANKFAGTADETNAKVLKVEEAIDTVGTIRWTVPRDYDEATDELVVRVLASQLTSSTDNDVELDAQVYVKTAGTALGSDLNPTAPGTVLSTTEQWIEFDLGGNSLDRDDVVYFTLITNGANDTDGEEVLIHDLEFVYRSCLVSYDEQDASSNDLR